MTFTAPAEFTTRPTLEGHFGMTASTHWLATASAQAVLERGGNAFDAAVAGAFVLHVVEPHLNGPGGDMTGVYFDTAVGRPLVLMGQGPAPAGATPEHYLAEGLELVPGSGALATAIPAAVDAWLLLLAEHGTWELADVLAFAIDYAANGHAALPRVGHTIGTVKELFEQHWPSSAALWMPHGRAPEAGETITNPAYARTLERLIEAGSGAADRAGRIEAARAAWSEGFVAEAATAFLSAPHRHASGTDHAGVISREDFAGFRAGTEEACTIEFRGYTIAKTGAWGQGPALLQTLQILAGYTDAELDPSTERGAHLITEAQKLAYADREAYYGDREVPLGVLLSEEYAAERRALIGERASLEYRPGAVAGHTPFTPPLRTEYRPPALAEGEVAAGVGEPTVARATPAPSAAAVPAGTDAADAEEAARDAAQSADRLRGEPVVEPTGETRGDTCHIDVVDRWGNMVSATPSGGWLQSSPAIPELGFCLGSRLQMTWLEEGSPSTLTPGLRPRTTLTPTLVLRDGLPVIALGSPGGDQQDQWQLLYLLRVLVGGYTPQQAIDAPALHTTSLPGSFWPRTWEPGGLVVEDRLGEDVISGLESRGHRITRAGEWALGRLSSVSRTPETGALTAAANPRGAQGYAAGR